jgi:thioredoxin-dependent peroxiredoxin
MNKFITAMAAFFVFAVGVMIGANQAHAAPLDVGGAAPDFTTDAALGGKTFTFNLAEKLKQGPVVLYFFPKVFTKGCTAEAHEFAEKTEEFNKLGATVIGLSADKIDEIAKFSVEECRNKFAVGRASPQIVKAYGVSLAPVGNMANRTTFVIAQDGNVALRFSQMDYRGHVSAAMDAVTKLAAKK